MCMCMCLYVCVTGGGMYTYMTLYKYGIWIGHDVCIILIIARPVVNGTV